jgi:hypothetical protein
MHQPPPPPPNSSNRGLIILFGFLGVCALAGCVALGLIGNSVLNRVQETLLTAEGEIPPDPVFVQARTTQEVANRAYCIRAVLAHERVMSANHAGGAIPPRELALIDQAIADPTAGVTPYERDLFGTHISIDEIGAHLNYSHHALAAFAWVLGHTDTLPSPISQRPALANILKDPQNLKPLRASPRLRSRDEILAVARKQQFLYYRLCYELDYRESLAQISGERLSDELLEEEEGLKIYPERRNGDLIVGTTTVNTLSKSLLESVAEANYAQLLVLTWALGWGEEWDETIVHHRAYLPDDPLARQSR